MKSLTITCHAAYNYGAVLQAYALQLFLKNQGYDNKIINYKPKYLRNKVGKPLVNVIWKIYRLPDFLVFKKTFDRFLCQNISMTKEYSSYSELKQCPPIADVYIVGSDQVWNYQMNNGNDDAFFLKFCLDEAVKASYAASIAQEILPFEIAEEYKKNLSSFDYVSVREKSAEILLSQIEIESVTTVVDPVFLLSKNQWLKIAAKKKYKEKYILVYSFNSTIDIIRYAKKLSSSMNCNIYMINTMWKDYRFFVDKHFWGISPNDFLTLFANAEHIVTNSFHGLAFSIIFEKQVSVFSKKQGGNCRLNDLMSSLCIPNCKNGINIDYSLVKQKLEIAKRKSMIYLEHIFTSKEEK